MKRFALVLVVAICGLAIAQPAFAEGKWTSYISGALTGFDSRQWSDSNSDSQSTDIRFDDCEDRNTNIEPDNVYIQLTKENTFTPDEDRGRKVEYCENTDTRYWGDQPSGNYHFTIIRINGNTSGGRVDVPFVKVWY